MSCIIFLSAVVLLMIGGFYVAVRSTMEDEIKAAIERDPAALSVPEVVLTYSGVHALFFFRVSSVLHRRKVRFLPRFISQFSRWLTGIEIHPGASIGKGLFIDHGMGVVIGETTIIGNNVTLFQGVTLGGTGKETGKRHPTIGDNVVVGAGAKVLGDISVGGGVNIGANAVVIRSVPEDSTVVGVPGRVARKKGRKIPGGINLDHTSLPDPLQQSIEKLQHEIDHIESEIEEYHVQKKKMTAKDADGEGSDI